MEMMKGTTPLAVELHPVTNAYGWTQTLKGISLTIEPGEVVAVRGPNGAGTVTLRALMLGMCRPPAVFTMIGPFQQAPRFASIAFSPLPLDP